MWDFIKWIDYNIQLCVYIIFKSLTKSTIPYFKRFSSGLYRILGDEPVGLAWLGEDFCKHYVCVCVSDYVRSSLLYTHFSCFEVVLHTHLISVVVRSFPLVFTKCELHMLVGRVTLNTDREQESRMWMEKSSTMTHDARWMVNSCDL